MIKKVLPFFILAIFICSLGSIIATDVTDISNNSEPNDIIILSDNDLSNNQSNESSISLDAENLTKYYNGSDRFEVSLTNDSQPIANQNITITINGVTYNETTNSSGVASVPIDLNVGNYTAISTYNGTYGFSTITNNIEVKTTINSTDLELYYKNGTKFSALFLDSNGNFLVENTTVKFIINNVEYNRTTNNKGIASIAINLASGKYTITSVNSNGENCTNTITVLSTINSTDITKYYRNATPFVVTLLNGDGSPLGSSVKVNFNINGVTYEKTTDENGTASLNINLDVGKYTITSTAANGDVKSNIINVISTIDSKDLTKYYCNATPFVVTLLNGDGSPLGSSVKVNFNINGVTYEKTTDENGTASLNINLDVGKYTITSTAANGDVKSNTINVISTIDSKDLTKYYKNDTPFVVTLLNGDGTPIANNTKVKFNITDINKVYEKYTNENGTASLNINLNPGKYTIVTTSPNGEEKTNTITVAFKIVTDDLVKYYKDDKKFVATLLNGDGTPVSNTEVYFEINGKTYERYTDSKGVASLTINLPADKYNIVTRAFVGDKIGNSIEVLSTINSTDLTKYYKNDSQFSVTILNTDGTPVSKDVPVYFNINGVEYTRFTDINGVATMKINLATGSYTITTSLDTGDAKSNKITVLSTINSTDLTKYYQNDSQFVVTILKGDGSPISLGEKVTFNINGVEYTRYTDENGTATMNINLSPGNYVITTTTSNGDVKSNNIKVFTLIMDDASLNYHAGNYSVKVVDKAGNPLANETVTFTINGVNYNRISDENGTASIAINLDYGVYNIIATYGGFANNAKLVVKANTQFKLESSTIKYGDYSVLHVTDSFNGNALKGVFIYYLVYYNSSSDPLVVAQYTDENGCSRVQWLLPAGSYQTYIGTQGQEQFGDTMTITMVKIVE